MDALTGKTLQGEKYLVGEELGRGGFGTTYKATHLLLNQPVVIKTLNESLRSSPLFPDALQKFQDEARRLVLCVHPNIVRVSDFFIEDDQAYIVMDYVVGQPLDAIVFPQRSQPEAETVRGLAEETAIHYIRQIGSALKVVHQNRLLHRDVKPQNILLRQGSHEVVLIDFGIAREFDANVTQTHTSMISSGYAPIEQYLPQAKRTPATDIYALAATLYALLTAQTPMASVLRCQIEVQKQEGSQISPEATDILEANHQPMPTPRELRPELSAAVDYAVMQGMALEARQRPASVDEWLALLPDVPHPDLQPAIAGAELTKTIAVSPNLLVNAKVGKPLSSKPVAETLKSPRLLWLGGGAIATLAALTLGTKLLSLGQPATVPAAMPTPSPQVSPSSASSIAPTSTPATPAASPLPSRSPAVAPGVAQPELTAPAVPLTPSTPAPALPTSPVPASVPASVAAPAQLQEPQPVPQRVEEVEENQSEKRDKEDEDQGRGKKDDENRGRGKKDSEGGKGRGRGKK